MQAPSIHQMLERNLFCGIYPSLIDPTLQPPQIQRTHDPHEFVDIPSVRVRDVVRRLASLEVVRQSCSLTLSFVAAA